VTGAHEAGALGHDAPPFRLGVLPGGTTNVVALDLRLPRRPADALRALLEGSERRMDVGVARDGLGRERPFVLGCGVGLDALATAKVSRRLKRWLGRHAYTVAALPFVGDRGRPLVVDYQTAGGGRVTGARAAWVIVGNTSHYGGPARLSPAASSQDGRLELVLLPSTRLLALLSVGWAASRGDAGAAPGVEVVQVVRVAVRSEEPVAFHVDAEAAGVTPVDVRVLPAALRVLVPPEKGSDPFSARKGV
jgi:diacylglycerol kinase family enzyme